MNIIADLKLNLKKHGHKLTGRTASWQIVCTEWAAEACLHGVQSVQRFLWCCGILQRNWSRLSFRRVSTKHRQLYCRRGTSKLLLAYSRINGGPKKTSANAFDHPLPISLRDFQHDYTSATFFMKKPSTLTTFSSFSCTTCRQLVKAKISLFRIFEIKQAARYIIFFSLLWVIQWLSFFHWLHCFRI